MKLFPAKWFSSAGLFLMVSLLVLPAVHAKQQTAPDQSKKMDSIRVLRAEKVAAFKAAFPKVAVQTNPVTGSLEDLWGDLSKNQTKTEHMEAAYEFFEQNKDLYGIGNPKEELKLQYRTEKMVDFTQFYKGVEIYRSSIGVYFTPAGKLKGIKGGFLPDIDISNTPSIDSSAALALVKQDLRLPNDYKSRELEQIRKGNPSGTAYLRIINEGGRCQLVWIVGLHVDERGEVWDYRIDATTGAILNKINVVKSRGEPRRELPFTPPKPTKESSKEKASDSAVIVIPQNGVPLYRIENGKAIPVSPHATLTYPYIP